ncbi:TraR/DksA C4-type zinc finger protein [Patescibacteria group bacterium]|nr:TraR/DksA C4-type zinc finger protein [Patescibacteria group bacterium]
MINISELVKIFEISIPLYFLFIVSGVIAYVFIVWRESVKDGFNANKVFDMTLSTTLFCGLLCFALWRYFEWNKLYNPINWILSIDLQLLCVFISVFLPVVVALIFCSRNKWSVYRVLDILTMGLNFFLFSISIGVYAIYKAENYLFFSLLLILIYVAILRFRGYKFTSGYIFSVYITFVAICMVLFFRNPGYLLFSCVLFTIGIVNFFMRRRIIMDRKPLTQEFLDKIKTLLNRKEKKLHQEELLLHSEDPYLQEGRSTDNSDALDDAILEDVAKEQLDDRINLIKRVKTQVRKALRALKIGTYGKCEVCGRDIDSARLKAYPETTYCLDCAKKLDEQE